MFVSILVWNWLGLRYSSLILLFSTSLEDFCMHCIFLCQELAKSILDSWRKGIFSLQNFIVHLNSYFVPCYQFNVILVQCSDSPIPAVAVLHWHNKGWLSGCYQRSWCSSVNGLRNEIVLQCSDFWVLSQTTCVIGGLLKPQWLYGLQNLLRMMCLGPCLA